MILAGGKSDYSTISRINGAAQKPLYLKGDFHGMTFDGPFTSVEAKIDIVSSHPGLAGYVFYETANITWLDENSAIEGSSVIPELVLKLN